MLLELLPRQDDMKELMLIKTSFLKLICLSNMENLCLMIQQIKKI